MTRQPPCATNPATGKPYTRHRWEQQRLRVTSYSPRLGGGMGPQTYAYERACSRCGLHGGTVAY